MSSNSHIKESFAYTFSSDEKHGAVDTFNEEGGRFAADLSHRPIEVPQNARHVRIFVDYVNIPHVDYNISAAKLNNTLEIVGTSLLGVPAQTYNLIIPDGIYEVFELSETIRILMFAAGAKEFIKLTPNRSNGKTRVHYLFNDVIINFVNSTIRTILGFTAVNQGPFPNVPHVLEGSSKALFRVHTEYIVHSDIVASGLRLNQVYHKGLLNIPIQVLPGDNVVHEASNSAPLVADFLKGRSISTLSFWVTNQDGNTMPDFNGECWKLRLQLIYWLPVDHFSPGHTSGL